VIENPQNDDIKIPCPLCGRRICDGQGHVPGGDFALELKCGICGFVWVTSRYLRKFLTKRERLVR